MRSKEKFEFIGKSLYFKRGILVFGDLHIGYEESLNEQGVFLPRVQFKETMKDLKKIFEKIGKVEKIIILGDLKHEFGNISSQEWKDVRAVLDFLKRKCGRIVLVKGNHDTILGPIAEREELEIADYYVDGGVCFLHGHRLFPACLDKEIEMLVLGHRHPAVLLSDKYKKEKYKCFLVGRWKRKGVVILPSFFPFVEGSDIVNLGENYLFIPEKNLKNFGVFVVGDEVYEFGKLKRLI